MSIGRSCILPAAKIPTSGKAISVEGTGSRYWTHLNPTGLVALTDTNTAIALRWTNNGVVDYDSVIIEKGTDQVTYTEHASIAAGLDAYTVTELSGQTRYFFRIRYKKGSDYSGYSNVASDVTLPTILYDGNTFAVYDEEALDTITKDGGNIVSRVNDKLGQGNDLVAGSCLLDSDGFKFNGSDQYLKTASKVWNQPACLYAWIKQISWTVSDFLYDGYNTACGINQSGASPECKLNAGASLANTSGLTVGQFKFMCGIANGANSKTRFGDTVATGSAGTNAPNGLTLGARQNNSLFSNVAYKKIFGRKIADSDENQTVLYNYYQSKFMPVTVVTSVATKSISGGVRITWVDSGSLPVEIWASEDGGASVLVASVANGVQTYDDTRAVGKVMIYSIRAKFGILYSDFVTSNITVSAVVLIQSIQGSSVEQVSISFLKGAGTVYLNWGYGVDVSIANGTYTSSFPSGNTTYEITLTGALSSITSIVCQNEHTVKVNVAELWKLTALSVCIFDDVYNYMDGALEGMPSTLTRLTLSPKTNSYGNPGSNQCTLSDPLFTWPVGLTELVLGSLAGNNPGTDSEKIFFDIEDLPATLTYLNISQAYNQNYGITGDESNMPPNMEKWLTQGCWGLEWSGGELPASLTEWYNENVNDPAFTGDLNTKLPVGLTKLFLVGNAAIASQSGVTGTMAGIASRCPDLAFIWVTEGFCYNLGSSLDPLAALTTLSIIVLASTGTKFSYSGGALPAWANTDINLGGKLTTAEVDSFLITYALTAGAGVKAITIADNNEPRSAASNAAKATLEGLGKIVTTN